MIFIIKAIQKITNNKNRTSINTNTCISKDKSSMHNSDDLAQLKIPEKIRSKTEDCDSTPLSDDDINEEFDPDKCYREWCDIYEYSDDINKNLNKCTQNTNLYDFPNITPDIIIIGAGPIGLWTAIQIKSLLPNIHILIFEKHEKYQRRHVLQMQKRAFSNINKDPKMNELREIIKKMVGNIRTNDLEEILCNFALKLGIQKAYREIDNVIELSKIYPMTKIIIGTDGSHSIVRKQLFPKGLLVNDTLQYIAFVKYEVLGKTEKLKMFSETYAGLKLVHHLVNETVGIEKNGRTPVTLLILIDQETYLYMENAKFKTPYNVNKDKDIIEPKLLETITIWLNIRTKFHHEEKIKDSIMLTVSRLDVYRSNEVGLKIPQEEIFTFICGDAAFGVPYFRALNNGFKLGSVLANLIEKNYENLDKAVIGYNKYFDRFSKAEIYRARKITFLTSLAKSALKFNANFPLQFFRLSNIKDKLIEPLSGQHLRISSLIIGKIDSK